MKLLYIDEEKRNNELELIENFIKLVPGEFHDAFMQKIGSHKKYISFNQFIFVNNLYTDETKKGIVSNHRPDIYYNESTKTVTIWFPYVNNNDYFENYINYTIKSIYQLEKLGVEHWILDFRNHPGGNLKVYVSVILPFVNKFSLNLHSKKQGPIKFQITGDTINWINPKNQVLFAEYQLTYIPYIVEGKISVLINQQSYSAAEFMPYILRENRGAKLYGYKTGGAISTMVNIDHDIFITLPFGEIINKDGSTHPPYLEPDVIGYPKEVDP